MAWNEPGNGKKDPWSSGGGDQPPDLDEVFRKLQRRLGGLFGGNGDRRPTRGGGGGGMGGLLPIFAVLAVAWLVYDSVYIVEEAERGVVLRFGKYNHTMQPGANFTFPRPIDRVFKVDVAQVRAVTSQGQMLTKDENIVGLNFGTQYRVNDAQNFLFKVRTPESTIREAAESALRQVIGDSEMDFILREGRAEIAADTAQLLQDILDRYETGLEVTALNLEDVRPPEQVKAAFDDAIKAREDEDRFKNEAEAYANQEIPEARGRAARITQEAEAYREAKIAQAAGEAKRFELLLAEYERAPEVTRQRLYLETMENVLRRASKVVIDVSDGNNIMYLPLDGVGDRVSRRNSAADRAAVGSASIAASDDRSREGRDSVRRGRESR